MSDTEKSKRPSHIAYQVRDGAEGASHFNRIGSAFAHKDGGGFSLLLDSVPINGRITLRIAKERSGVSKDRGEIER